MSRQNSFPYRHTEFHAFSPGDVIVHRSDINQYFYVDTLTGTGYKCFWFVDGEPDCERGIGFLFEDEAFLRKIEI